MAKSLSLLSSDFLVSKGVPITKSLRDWLNRASALSNTRPSDADRQKYERWALGIVEDALREPGGVEGKKWDHISPVMPSNAGDRELTFLVPELMAITPLPSVKGPTPDHRNALVSECMRRSPSELRPYVMRVLHKMDTEVAAGKRNYNALTFMEILKSAQDLQRVQVSLMSNTNVGVKTTRPHTDEEKQYKKKRIESILYTGEKKSNFHLMSNEKVSGGLFFQNLLLRQTQLASSQPFLGKSRELERMYSRYEPTSDDIRPPNVLVKALSYVSSKSLEKERLEGSISSARYLNEQLKGMRQDIRVQDLSNEFAVDVYEKHALICLQLGDIGEFNQCQAALKKLYEILPNNPKSSMSDFFCYRLSYLCLGGQYDALSTELIHYANVTAKNLKNHKSPIKKMDVRWTLRLCTACEDGDTFTICRALMMLPHGMHMLMKIYLQKCRMRWLRDFLGSLRGVVSMRFIMACLGFTPVRNILSQEHKSLEDFFWLDESYEEAKGALENFFETIKFSLPKRFSFRNEIDRDVGKKIPHNSDGFSHEEEIVFVDAAEMFKCVDEYISYLGTRRDARLDNMS